MKGFFRGIFPVIVLFLYIYPQMILGFPISTRIMMGGLGIISFFHKHHKAFIFRPFKGGVAIVICSLIAAVGNSTWNFQFVGYFVSMLMIFFAAYLFLSLFPLYIKKKDGLESLLKVYVNAVLVQSFFAVIMFVIPSLGEKLMAIFPVMGSDEIIEHSLGFRLIGLGSAFFGAGVINGLGLITIVYLYLKGYIHNVFKWVIIYIFIFFVGMMMARTTVIGFTISIFLLLIWKPLNQKEIVKKWKWIVILLMAIVIAISFILANASENLINFIFEFFQNYDKTGRLESASTNRMMEMYVWPDNLRTWLIGDGLFNLGEDYYMSTDVGFMRLIYYGGIPIMIAYYYFSWYIVSSINKLGIDKPLKYLIYSCFLYQMILNIKGLVDINFFFLLIYLCVYLHKKWGRHINFYENQLRRNSSNSENY